MNYQREMIIERIVTVKYLDPSMSQNLLKKFPDDSAFGFNYSESGIWSPLLPRGRVGSEAFRSSGKLRRMKGKGMKWKKVVDNVVTKKLDFSPAPPPTLKRGCNRLLKAVARRFKMQGRVAIRMILRTL